MKIQIQCFWASIGIHGNLQSCQVMKYRALADKIL